MRISDVRITPATIRVEAPLRHSWGTHDTLSRIIVEVVTDDGLVGLGEAYGEAHRLLALQAARQTVLGRDPFALEDLRLQLMAPGQIKLWTGPIAAATYAAYECACLDVIGQSIGRPLHDLLGGAVRTRVPHAAYLFYRHPDEDGFGAIDDGEGLVAHARDLVDRYGFTTLKFKNGVFDPRAEVEDARAIREAFPDHRLRIDPNGVWSIGTAVRAATALRTLDIEYLEDPTWGLTGVGRVAAQVPGMVLASNQAVFGFEDLAANQANRSIDVVLADIHWYGGLTGVKHLGRMAEAYGFDLGLHSGSEFGISQAAQLHAAAATPNLGDAYALDSHYHHLVDDVIAGGKLPLVDGEMAVPQEPGLGVRLDRDKLQTYHEFWSEKSFTSWTQDKVTGSSAPRIPKW